MSWRLQLEIGQWYSPAPRLYHLSNLFILLTGTSRRDTLTLGVWHILTFCHNPFSRVIARCQRLTIKVAVTAQSQPSPEKWQWFITRKWSIIFRHYGELRIQIFNYIINTTRKKVSIINHMGNTILKKGEGEAEGGGGGGCREGTSSYAMKWGRHEITATLAVTARLRRRDMPCHVISHHDLKSPCQECHITNSVRCRSSIPRH